MPDLAKITTGRRTLVSWRCPNGTRNEGAVRVCPCCTRDRVERHAQIHSAERAVVYVNPITGERRTPPRADQQMPEVYSRQGFERREIMSMTQYERETGSVHEASNYASGNEPVTEAPPMRPHAPKEVIDSLVNEVRAAIQSGPWTMERPLSDGADSE